MSVTPKYTPQQTALGREQMLKEHVEPKVRKYFQRYPTLRSATLLVAQFWNDEADDAVHDRLIFSELETPDLRAASDFDDWDIVNLPDAPDEDFLRAVQFQYIEQWHSNNDAIPLFAAFTREGCDQGMDLDKSFTPYAHFRRSGAELLTEVVGVMLRPWLDGVRPSYDSLS